MNSYEEENFSSEEDIIELEDEDGNITEMIADRYFFYNGEEYVLLTEKSADDEDIGCLVMKVVAAEENGEELESFEPIVDDELAEKLFEIATTQYNEDEEIDE